MDEGAVLPPVKAHQQVPSIPLLRRPRPPLSPSGQVSRSSTTTSVSGGYTKSVVDEGMVFDSELAEKKLRAISTPVHPLPRHHPTPLSRHRHSRTLQTTTHPPSSQIPPICEQQTDNAEDPNSMESGFDSDVIIHPLFPRGPQFFPPGKRKLKKRLKSLPHNWWEKGENGDLNFHEFAPHEDELENDDSVAEYSEITTEDTTLYEPPSKLRGKILSRQNYLKLTGWFATHVPQQDSLNTLDISIDRCVPEGRKPYHQILLELEALINKAIETTEGERNIRGREGGGEREGDGGRERGRGRGGDGGENCWWPTPRPGDIVFQSSTSRYFCGQGRSDSPFDGGGQPLISPSEVAILESMMDGGYRLSLKAHFLSSLPLLSPLSLTLTHLNLSFNNLDVFPNEVMEMTRLQSLRMRNNPIKVIPNDIQKLEKLKVFCISFNLLTNLPPGLFELASLVELDVSHNMIQDLSKDIRKLSNLRKLNIESNELIGFPSSLLSLPLTHLSITGNYTHPALWKENTKSPPQPLIALCCVIVSSSTADPTQLPSWAQHILQFRRQLDVRCDFCNGYIFGRELTTIKSQISCHHDYPVKSLPVLFKTCSLSCKGQL